MSAKQPLLWYTKATLHVQLLQLKYIYCSNCLVPYNLRKKARVTTHMQ